MGHTWESANERARRFSKAEGCTQYINALVQLVNDVPTIVGYSVSDWYSTENTVRTYYNGEIR